MPDKPERRRARGESLFPYRQLYIRSRGTVRCIDLSPRLQAVVATMAAAIVIAAAAVPFVHFGSTRVEAGAFERERAQLRQMRTRMTAAQALLAERAETWRVASSEFERRHEVLYALLDAIRRDEGLSASLDEGGRERVLVNTTTDEGAPRRDRPPAPRRKSSVGKDVGLAEAQLQFLDVAERIAVGRREFWLGVLRETGVEPRRLLRGVESGGPEIDLARPETMAADDPFFVRVRRVAARLEEARLIERLVEAVPLGRPVGVPSRTTSGFGRRLDPVTGRPAWHAGIDIAAHPRAPILATASGRVTYAGRRSGYGNVVEIAHGRSLKTRYGHLHSIAVVQGDKVTRGQRIGAMGSTGRSTGVHLHYEISFEERVYNPARFFGAGAYAAAEREGG